MGKADRNPPPYHMQDTEDTPDPQAASGSSQEDVIEIGHIKTNPGIRE